MGLAYIIHLVFIGTALLMWAYIMFFTYISNKTIRHTNIKPPRFIRGILTVIPALCAISVISNIILILAYFMFRR